MRKSYNLEKPLFSQWSNHRISRELQVIDKILDEIVAPIGWVYEDLSIGSKSSAGAHGMTAEQVLRAAIVKQQNQWSYETLELQCVDSSMTQAFVRLDDVRSFSKSCLQANISRIRAITWSKINDLLIKYAAERDLERGRTVRMDATVIKSNIHHPTDSALLYDCIRTANAALKML